MTWQMQRMENLVADLPLNGGSNSLYLAMESDVNLLGNRDELHSAFGNLLSTCCA